MQQDLTTSALNIMTPLKDFEHFTMHNLCIGLEGIQNLRRWDKQQKEWLLNIIKELTDDKQQHVMNKLQHKHALTSGVHTSGRFKYGDEYKWCKV